MLVRIIIEKTRKIIGKNRQTERIIIVGYIIYEKLISIVYRICGLLPIKNNKIVFSAMQGDCYGDNPFYISEIIKKDCKYDIVWLINPKKEIKNATGIRTVSYSSLSAIRELSTAKVWVDSNMKRSGFLKRKGQLYIQTWHGSYGLKKIAFDLGEKLPIIDRRIYRYNANKIDLMISNSAKTSEIYRRAFGYKGQIIELGSPRNDLLFDDSSQYREKIRDYYSLPQTTKLVLYAPTFRSDFKVDAMRLDFERLLNALERKYNGRWVLLVRLHYKNMEEAEGFIKYSDRIVNATYYGVMQELLAGVDILITDYSSCMFDFANTRKPCFIYASDLKQYNLDRGNYFAMEELPFPLAENNDELERNIINFDEKQYYEKMNSLFLQVGLKETGQASKKVAEYIINWINENNNLKLEDKYSKF